MLGARAFNRNAVSHDRIRRVFLLALIVASLLSPSATWAQTFGSVGISGRVKHTATSPPSYRSGDHVLIYDLTSAKWIGPALTDANGWFAFTDLPSGRDYVLAVFVGRRSISSNRVTYDGTPLRYDIEVHD